MGYESRLRRTPTAVSRQKFIPTVKVAPVCFIHQRFRQCKKQILNAERAEDAETAKGTPAGAREPPSALSSLHYAVISIASVSTAVYS